MGGPVNPPDKPYVVKTLSDNDDQATAELQAARDAGFQVIAAADSVHGMRVILGAYKGK
jgi:hypothetical protein